MAESMKGHGVKTKGMVKGMNVILMGMSTKESIQRESHMERESSIGSLVRFMMESGKRE